MNDLIFRQRKYSLAVAFTLASIAGLFTGHVSEGSFIALAGLIIGLYGAANVGQRAVER